MEVNTSCYWRLLEIILPNKYKHTRSDKKYTELEDIIVYQRAMEVGEKINTIVGD